MLRRMTIALVAGILTIGVGASPARAAANGRTETPCASCWVITLSHVS